MTEDEIRQIVHDEIRKSNIIFSIDVKNDSRLQETEYILTARLACSEEADKPTIRTRVNDG